MRRRLSLFIGALALAPLGACAHKGAGASAEEIAAKIEEICKMQACREETTQEVMLDATHMYQGVYDKSPIIAGPGVLTILPGESFEIDATVGIGGKLEELRVVESEGKLSIKLIAEPGSTKLTVQSTFDRPLRYCAYINIVGYGRVKTSIVGVIPKGLGLEIWSDPIIEIVLTQFQLTDTQQECR